MLKNFILVLSLVFVSGCSKNIASFFSLTNPMPSPSPSVNTVEWNDNANAELLREMFLVVFQREPSDISEFNGYVSAMNQGASLEGIYNGLAHSSDYRKLEQGNPGASIEALNVFCEELTGFELQLTVPTEFTPASAQPLAAPVMPDGSTHDEYDEATPEPEESRLRKPVKKEQLIHTYSKQFGGASIFTLKRVLGDEALKVIEEKKRLGSLLSRWYADWVVSIGQRNINFGLELRNKPDEKFHYQWALTAERDRLTWEVLNRVHRVLNESNRQNQ